MTAADCSGNSVDQRAIFVAWDWHTHFAGGVEQFLLPSECWLEQTRNAITGTDARQGRWNVRFQVGFVGQFKVVVGPRPETVRRVNLTEPDRTNRGRAVPLRVQSDFIGRRSVLRDLAAKVQRG